MKVEIAPDREKAKALLAMAKVTLERLHEINPEKYPSNTLIDYYDTIHKLLDAIACIQRIKFKGEGAHQDLIGHISNAYFSEKERIFLQQMREYRNKIQYEGFTVNVNYITQNVKKNRPLPVNTHNEETTSLAHK